MEENSPQKVMYVTHAKELAFTTSRTIAVYLIAFSDASDYRSVSV